MVAISSGLVEPHSHPGRYWAGAFLGALVLTFQTWLVIGVLTWLHFASFTFLRFENQYEVEAGMLRFGATFCTIPFGAALGLALAAPSHRRALRGAVSVCLVAMALGITSCAYELSDGGAMLGITYILLVPIVALMLVWTVVAGLRLFKKKEHAVAVVTAVQLLIPVLTAACVSPCLHWSVPSNLKQVGSLRTQLEHSTTSLREQRKR